ncbi:zinc finger protein 157-like, partial [Hippocampus comes]|uniref:zinc finger protein 157-like n=1 Tax=Hippocampus comes TaxID=109280 RepID=UPI00094E6426
MSVKQDNVNPALTQDTFVQQTSCGSAQHGGNSDPKDHDDPDHQEQEDANDTGHVDGTKHGLQAGKQSGRNSSNRQPRARQAARQRDKNFSCSLCGRTFALRRSLNVHMRQHTGQCSPY